MVTVDGIDELRELIGQPIGPSEGVEITQEDIDKFAEVSRDDQWIHVDVERAKRESPYGRGAVGAVVAFNARTPTRCEFFLLGPARMTAP
jgi:acyl dehydratase